MGTHAIIAKTSQRNGRTVTAAIGVHNDGYPEATGWLLHHYYNDEAAIDRLLDNDCISRLGVSPQARPYPKDGNLSGLDTIASPNPNPIPGYRQQGDHRRMTDTDWWRRVDPHWVYLYDNGQWLVRNTDNEFQLLAAILDERNDEVVWPFEQPDGTTEYRNREWVLANLPPR